jgi:hypothetical protein
MSIRLVARRGPRSPSTATAMHVAGGMADSSAPSGLRQNVAAPRLEMLDKLCVCACVCDRIL